MRKYPLYQDETLIINTTQDLLASTENLITKFQKDPQINVGKYAFKDIMYYDAIVKIYSIHHNKIKNILTLLTSPSFEYIDRKEIYPYVIPYSNYPKVVEYQYQDSTFSQPFNFPAAIDSNSSSLHSILADLKKMHDDLSNISKEVDGKLVVFKQQTDLKEKEDILVQKHDYIISIFNNNSELNNFNNYHNRFSTNTLELTSEKFKNYAKLSLNEKIVKIDEIIKCFDDIIHFYNKLADLPKKLKRIDDLYTRTVWSPVTLTNMEERMKQNLYNTYENYILPQLLLYLDNINDCNKLNEKAANLEKVYKKMVALREQDTKEIEKQLRRPKVLTIQEIDNILLLNLNLE